ncbi:MAG: polyprenyl synthetase family protein [Clostridia bacterium]
MTTDSFQAYFEVRLNATIETIKPEVPERLYEAIYYTISSGGKRVRPYLMFLIADLLNVPKEKVLGQAISLECIHTYSLIHDDLPCMDDDDYRRGKESCHNKFGEAMAILCGDSLLNFAYENLFNTLIEDNSLLESCRYLAKKAGSTGMINGQMVELFSFNMTEDLYKFIYDKKTSELIKAAIMVPVIIAGVENSEAYEKFAENLGLMFQLMDDLIDYDKDEGSLAQHWGKKQTKEKIDSLSDDINMFLDTIEDSNAKKDLSEFVKFLSNRSK